MRFRSLALALAVAACHDRGAAAPPAARSPAAVSAPEPSPADTLTPAALAAELARPAARRPVVLHVGFRPIFEAGHIPGALDMGPASTQEGRDALQAELKTLRPGQEAVLYCGCCPWDHCPNIRPALALAHRLGLQNVKVLAIPETFRTDWIKAGFPVEK